MPKSYSEQEKTHIVRRLKEEARNCLEQYGIKRTTVDELVKRVQIPKGTFYIFYESKEALLFEVITELHDAMERTLVERITTYDGIGTDTLCDVLFDLYKMASESAILRLITSGEIEILLRKLPPEVIESHFSQDDSMIDRLTAVMPGAAHADTGLMGAAFRAVFMTMLHRDEIGAERFDDVVRLLLKGVVTQLFTQ